jgi:hypothetical protein
MERNLRRQAWTVDLPVEIINIVIKPVVRTLLGHRNIFHCLRFESLYDHRVSGRAPSPLSKRRNIFSLTTF